MQMPASSPSATGPAPPAVANAPLDLTRLARIRWRCRRGLLENDIVLARFLDAHAATLDEQAVAQLDVLLDLPDGELWDLIAGRAEPADATLAMLVEALRRA